MAQTSEHGRIIAAAAKAALTPIGCRRRGQSRVWISDQRCWVIAVDFQPSAWSRGTYLNVTPSWLWLRMGGTQGSNRVEDFIPFENAEQFTPLITEMANRAAKEVLALREKFRSLSDIYNDFVGRVTGDGYPVYRAAVTAGLVRDVQNARHLFERMEALETHGYQSLTTMKSESAAFAALLDDPQQYRSAALNRIEERRQVLQLPTDPRCLEPTDSTDAL